MENIIIYKQKDKYYSLTFDCGYPPVKKNLRDVRSIDYFLSIVPVLNKRDKFIKAMHKKNQYFPMTAVDGRYDEVYIYHNNIRQRIFLHDDDTPAARRTYFWINKELKLIELIAADLSL